MRKFFLILLLMAITSFGQSVAQTLEVYSIEGTAEVVTGKTKHKMRLREKLSARTVISLGYEAQVELVDVKNKKQYVLRTPGRKTVGELINDRRNSTLTLSQRYLEYIQAQLRGKGQVVSRRCSDPATVTRDFDVDSMFVKEPITNNITP